MDFDEYDYLEKTSENPENGTVNEAAANNNGLENNDKSDDPERRRSSRHRGGDDDTARDLKRSKNGEEREKGSSRHRSRSRDGERVDRDRHRSSRGHRDREEGNGKGRDRDRDQERSRKESDREKEKEPERRRSGSRSDRHHQSERNEKDRAMRQDRDLKEKEREKELREREMRRHKEKREERVEPEVDPERDQRTVFAYQICLKADERDVYEFFSKAGKVRDVRLIMDRISRRSKGVGYIEFYDVMSVPMAIAMSGQPLLGIPVMVKPSEAEKNLVQSTTTAGPGGQIGLYSGGARRLYVGNLHINITEDQLRQVFEPFGTVELVQLPRDEAGHCKGFGFIQFARLEDSRAAQSLDGQIELAGRPLKVSPLTDQMGVVDAGGNTGDLDDDEGGGLSLNARSRAMLMQKLDRSGTATMPNPGLPLPLPHILGTVPGMPFLVPPSIPAIPVPGFAGAVDPIGIPSECVMLNNMFDPATESEPDFDLDIKEDVEAECSKFGKVKHIYVDKNSAGLVYLRFENTQAAMGAQRSLHGRWFAGKMITASFMVMANYEAKFPDSK